jgi:hypothetical protein
MATVACLLKWNARKFAQELLTIRLNRSSLPDFEFWSESINPWPLFLFDFTCTFNILFSCFSKQKMVLNSAVCWNPALNWEIAQVWVLGFFLLPFFTLVQSIHHFWAAGVEATFGLKVCPEIEPKALC